MVPGPLRTRLEVIADATSSLCDISRRDLMRKHGKQATVVWRQAMMYAMRCLTDASFPEIGAFMGLDHSTVQHAYKRVHGCATRRILVDRITDLIRSADKPIVPAMQAFDRVHGWLDSLSPEARRLLSHNDVTRLMDMITREKY